MRAISEEEYRNRQSQVLASIRPGTFFTEQVGASNMYRLFYCSGIVEGRIRVIEMSSIQAKCQLILNIDDVPYVPGPYSINIANYVDKTELRAQDAYREYENVKK